VKVLFIITFVIFLSGCAALTPQERTSLSDYQLCKFVFAPGLRGSPRQATAIEELNARGQDCSAYASAIQQNQDAALSMMLMGANILNNESQRRNQSSYSNGLVNCIKTYAGYQCFNTRDPSKIVNCTETVSGFQCF